MAKVPILGTVKTRLGRDIGPAQATRFFRANASAVLGRLARDPRFKTYLAIAPNTGLHTRAFDPNIPRIGQGRGDLGARMQRLLDHGQPGPVIVIGTDIPSVQPTHIASAFRQLGQADAVFGPAEDGGFWLVGLKRFPRTPRCFKGVRWSHPETLADTTKNLAEARVAFAITLSDVDAPTDLIRLRDHIGRRVIGAGPHYACPTSLTKNPG
jgi:uncharacterized protein